MKTPVEVWMPVSIIFSSIGIRMIVIPRKQIDNVSSKNPYVHCVCLCETCLNNTLLDNEISKDGTPIGEKDGLTDGYGLVSYVNSH